MTFDTHALEGSAAEACLGVPEQVEKTGTWVNVDGHARRLHVARPAPAGVEPLTRTLAELSSLVSTSQAGAR